jgi:hypothetical protein
MDEITWARCKRDILRRHPPARELGGELRLVLVFDTTRVAVRIRRLEGARLELLAEVARADSFEPAEALRWNAELDTGALALVADVYVVRCVVDDLADAHVEHRLRGTAADAANLKRLTHSIIDPACCGITFANYAE